MTNEQNTKPQRYEMKKDYKEPLKIFFMIIRPLRVGLIHDERAIGIVGYRADEAIKKAKEEYVSAGMGVISYGNDFVLVEDIMKRINVEGIIITEAPMPEIKEPKFEVEPKMGIEGFKLGLMMVLNDYIENEQDKENLKRIIENLTTKKNDN